NSTQNSLQETMGGTVEAAALTTNQVETKEEENYEVYIVKEGDSLAGICKRQYGNTDKIKEICLYNNIENEDHISPGQKIYLPR
ncbi:MAG: LysM peptidoglycan-binding domain-containing protein, partial [Lachnospiraceae bacterium]